MELTRRRAGEIEIVALQGRLDAFTSGAIEEQILEQIDGGVQRMIVDMQAVDYVSSVGLRLLLKAAKRLRDLEGRFAVTSLQPTVREAFEFSGLAAVFPAFGSTEEALARWS
jgi:anti-sigma B factor antagonist